MRADRLFSLDNERDMRADRLFTLDNERDMRADRLLILDNEKDMRADRLFTLSNERDMRALFHGRVEVSPVEFLHLNLLDRALVQAVQGDGISVRVGARDREALDAALLAEEVLGLVGAVGVGAHLVVAGHQLEVLDGHDEVARLLLGAQAAVALQHDEGGRGSHLEAHGAAVAAAAVRHQRALAHLSRLVVSLGVLDDGLESVVAHH